MAPKKGALIKKVAKTTGTTKGEARGVLKQVRSKVREGDTVAAYTQLRKALSGGPTKGVPATKAQKAEAIKRARHVVTRIQKNRAK